MKISLNFNECMRGDKDYGIINIFFKLPWRLINISVFDGIRLSMLYFEHRENNGHLLFIILKNVAILVTDSGKKIRLKKVFW